MLQATKRRLAQAHATEIEGDAAADAGFTLIELMVVLLIIAILLAIAIPTFLGVTNTAGDRAAQSNLTNALTEAKALYQVNQSYTNSSGSGSYTSGQFQSQAPEFTWTQATATANSGQCATTASNCVSFAVFNVGATNDGQGLALAVTSSKTNTCWYAFDVETTPSASIFTGTGTGNFATAGTFYGKSTSIPSGGCYALNPDTDTHVTFTSGQGQSYSNANTMS
jgi:type IV pilus assembly protein PilA